MADVAWSDNINLNSASMKTYEAVITDTNTDTAILPLDPTKDVTFAIKSSNDLYTVDVIVYLEDVLNATPIAYDFADGAGTVSGVDSVNSSIGPITGIKFDAKNAEASETATIQVLQF